MPSFAVVTDWPATVTFAPDGPRTLTSTVPSFGAWSSQTGNTPHSVPVLSSVNVVETSRPSCLR
ncbi:Uncharacterised protein [Mycobacteroides abscessus subsp. abscessus]|nr:Uncharacterised protein [Mycobacteroides abscessus subsp. abscessus]